MFNLSSDSGTSMAQLQSHQNIRVLLNCPVGQKENSSENQPKDPQDICWQDDGGHTKSLHNLYVTQKFSSSNVTFG